MTTAKDLVLSINDVFIRGKERFRLLEFDRERRRVYYISLTAKNPLPEFWGMSLFDHRDFRASIKVVGPCTLDRPEIESAADQAVGGLRMNRVEALIKEFGLGLLDKATRHRHLVEYAARIGTTDRTLLADLRLWWLGGQTKLALNGNFFRSGEVAEASTGALVFVDDGSRTLFSKVTATSRGRKPTGGAYQPFPFTSDLRKLAFKIGKDYYQEDESKSIRAACDVVVRKLFSQKDQTGKPLRDTEGKRILSLPYGQRPSDRQIYYLLAKALNLTETFKKRSGKSEFDNNHAPATGSVLDDCVGPGSVYEIDATFIDLWIVAKGDRKTILGKCTAYLIIDRWSKLICGFWVSLENPSWAEAQQAILSLAGNWQTLCNRLGVQYRTGDWPAQGVLGSRFVGDRGEMISKKSNVLCDDIRIEVTNPPAKASKRKCIVECGFKTTQIPLKDTAPAYEPPTNPFKRRGKKYDKDACLTLDELAAIYLLAIIKHNSRVWTGRRLTPEQILAGDLATPLNLWKQGIEDRVGTPPRYAYGNLRKSLMPKAEATVKVDGIFYRDCAWEFDDPRCKEWLSRASLVKQFAVPIAYNPGSVDEIYIFDPHDKRKHYIGHLTSDFKHLAGYTFAEAWALKRSLDKLDKEGAKYNQELRNGLAEDIESISKPAHAEMKAKTAGMKLGSRHGPGKDVREAEARQRRGSANSLTGPQTTGVAPVPNGDPTEDDADSNVVSLSAKRRTRPRPNVASRLPSALVETTASSEAPIQPSNHCEPDVMSDLLNIIGQQS